MDLHNVALAKLPPIHFRASAGAGHMHPHETPASPHGRRGPLAAHIPNKSLHTSKYRAARQTSWAARPLGCTHTQRVPAHKLCLPYLSGRRGKSAGKADLASCNILPYHQPTALVFDDARPYPRKQPLDLAVRMHSVITIAGTIRGPAKGPSVN